MIPFALLIHFAGQELRQVQTPAPVRGPVIVLPPRPDLANEELSLEEAVNIALVKSPQIEIARAAAEAARGRANAGAASLGPQISATASYQKQERSGDDLTSTRDEPVSASVRIQQLLFDFSRTRNQVRQLDNLAVASSFDLMAIASTVRRDVKNAYADLMNSNQTVDIRQQDLRIRQQQLELAEARLQDRLGAPGDVVRARTSVANAMALLADSEAQRAASMARLALLLGIDPATPINVSTNFSFTSTDEDVHLLVKQALEQRPEALGSTKRVESAENALSAAEQGSSPSVFATASVSGTGRTDPTDRRTTLYGVEMSWPLFDSGLTRGRVQEARAQRDQARANLIQTRLDISQQVIQAWIDYRGAAERAELQQIAVANAEESARIAQGRYAEGLGSFLEVTDAQSALLQARLSLSQALADLSRASANLEWATGQSVQSG